MQFMIAKGVWFAGAFLFMEVFSWTIHKYLMHGILWRIHKTHHLPQKSFFEWNDLFSLFFGGVAAGLIFSGVNQFDYRFWAGLGIACYGMFYFVLHDLLIHARGGRLRVTGNRYLKGLTRAHKMHHKHTERTGAESFGLLWVSKKYFK